MLFAVSGALRRMRRDARDSLTVAKNCQPVLGALLFEFENVRLVVADVMKKVVPRRANFVLPPAPHCFQADFPSDGDLLFCHYGVVHFHPHGKCHHDNSVCHGRRARLSGHARIVKLGRLLLIEINFDACDQCVDAPHKSGIDGTQNFGVRINVLDKCVEHYAVTPAPPCLRPCDFIVVFQQNAAHP